MLSEKSNELMMRSLIWWLQDKDHQLNLRSSVLPMPLCIRLWDRKQMSSQMLTFGLICEILAESSKFFLKLYQLWSSCYVSTSIKSLSALFLSFNLFCKLDRGDLHLRGFSRRHLRNYFRYNNQMQTGRDAMIGLMIFSVQK